MKPPVEAERLQQTAAAAVAGHGLAILSEGRT